MSSSLDLFYYSLWRWEMDLLSSPSCITGTGTVVRPPEALRRCRSIGSFLESVAVVVPSNLVSVSSRRGVGMVPNSWYIWCSSMWLSSVVWKCFMKCANSLTRSWTEIGASGTFRSLCPLHRSWSIVFLFASNSRVAYYWSPYTPVNSFQPLFFYFVLWGGV